MTLPAVLFDVTFVLLLAFVHVLGGGGGAHVQHDPNVVLGFVRCVVQVLGHVWWFHHLTLIRWADDLRRGEQAFGQASQR